MSDDERVKEDCQDEQDPEDNPEHEAAHEQFATQLKAIVNEAGAKGHLELECVVSELVGMTAALCIMGSGTKEEFLEGCGNIFDSVLEHEKEESGDPH